MVMARAINNDGRGLVGLDFNSLRGLILHLLSHHSLLGISVKEFVNLGPTLDLLALFTDLGVERVALGG